MELDSDQIIVVLEKYPELWSRHIVNQLSFSSIIFLLTVIIKQLIKRLIIKLKP